jgi:survival-of-motor-neuron-related-splicing factor 30
MKSKNETSIEEIEAKISEYKQNLLQIETILEREKEKTMQMQEAVSLSRINDLINLKKDLILAISYQEDLKKFKTINDPNIFNTSPLISTIHTGKICTGFFEGESRWYLAIIHEINQNDQTANIQWLGFKENATLPFKFIKIQDTTDKADLEIGADCEAIYYEEGKWYQASIEKISELGVHVKYKKYEEVEVVSFDSVRITPDQKLANYKKKQELQKKGKESDTLEFKIPDYLKISPADNEAQRLSKRKRVKSMKNNHKQKVIEKISNEKQQVWQNFAEKINKSKMSIPSQKIDRKVNL